VHVCDQNDEHRSASTETEDQRTTRGGRDTTTHSNAAQSASNVTQTISHLNNSDLNQFYTKVNPFLKWTNAKRWRNWVASGDVRPQWMWHRLQCVWRDALETVINSRKLSDALGNPSTQRKCFYCPIWQIMLYFIRQEQLYALLKNKRKETYIKSNTPHK